jgi:hypothetical protein
MTTFKDFDTFKRNLERAQSAAESAAYQAETAAREASDAEDEATSASNLLSELVEEVESLIGFNPDAAKNAMASIENVQRLHTMAVDRLRSILDGENTRDYKWGNLNSMIDMLITSDFDNLGHHKWDEGFEVAMEWVEGYGYCYIVRKIKEVANV